MLRWQWLYKRVRHIRLVSAGATAAHRPVKQGGYPELYRRKSAWYATLLLIRKTISGKIPFSRCWNFLVFAPAAAKHKRNFCMSEAVAIAAVSEMKPGRYSEKDGYALYIDVIRQFLSEWNVKPNDIQGLLACPSGMASG